MSSPSTSAMGLVVVSDDDAGAGLALRKREVHTGTSKKQEYDFQAEVARMLENAKQRQPDAGGLQVDAIGFAPILSARSVVDPLEQLLEQAQQAIRAEQYAEALALLATLLKQRPDHAEAIYLTAYCQAHRSDDEAAALQALRTLRPLRPTGVAEPLATRVAALRETIRNRRLASIIERLNALRQDSRNPIAFLRDEIDLDPACAVLHFVLASELLEHNDPEAAVRAIDESLPLVTPDEQQPLMNLRDMAITVLTVRALEPARDLYRQRRYPQAYGALTRVAAHRDTRLFMSFESYLRELSAGATGFWSGLLTVGKTRTPADVRPIGDAKALDELGFFLVRPDLDALRALNAQGGSLDNTRRAVQHARIGTEQAPWFPFIHFLYAEMIHARFMHAVDSQNPPSLEDIEADLLEAKTHYEIAATDPEIQLDEGMSRTHELLEQVTQTKRERQRQREETRKINAAIQTFNDIVSAGSDGVNDMETWRGIRTRLQTLNKELPALRQNVTNDAGKEAVDALIEAVKKNLALLNEIEPRVRDDDAIGKLLKAFNDRLEYLRVHKISSLAALRAEQAWIDKMIVDARNMQPTMRTDHGRQNLQKLMQQFESLKVVLRK